MRDGAGSSPLVAVAIVLGASALALLLPRLPSSRTLMLGLDDLLVAFLAPAEPQHRGVAVVAIDEDTLAAAACRSPIDRFLLAGIVERLASAGVRAIGLDVLLDQPTNPEADARLGAACYGRHGPRWSPSPPRPARSWASGSAPGTPTISRASPRASPTSPRTGSTGSSAGTG